MMRILAWPLWWGGVLLSVATGFIYGWVPTNVDWFRVPRVDDRFASAGGYAAAAVVLLAAATALEAWDGPRNARRLCIGIAGLYTFLALHAALIADAPVAVAWSSFNDGIGHVLFTPWTLFHLAAGAIGWALIVHRNRAAKPPVLG